MTIRELVSVLVDNAVKYSTENGNISVSLVEELGHKKLTVKNSTTVLKRAITISSLKDFTVPILPETAKQAAAA